MWSAVAGGGCVVSSGGRWVGGQQWREVGGWSAVAGGGCVVSSGGRWVGGQQWREVGVWSAVAGAGSAGRQTTASSRQAGPA